MQMQYSTVQYSAVQCSIEQCSAEPCLLFQHRQPVPAQAALWPSIL